MTYKTTQPGEAVRELPTAGPRRSYTCACASPTGKVMRLASKWRRHPTLSHVEWTSELLLWHGCTAGVFQLGRILNGWKIMDSYYLVDFEGLFVEPGIHVGWPLGWQKHGTPLKFDLLCWDVCQRECSLQVSDGGVGVTLTRSYFWTPQRNSQPQALSTILIYRENLEKSPRMTWQFQNFGVSELLITGLQVTQLTMPHAIICTASTDPAVSSGSTYRLDLRLLGTVGIWQMPPVRRKRFVADSLSMDHWWELSEWISLPER